MGEIKLGFSGANEQSNRLAKQVRLTAGLGRAAPGGMNNQDY